MIGGSVSLPFSLNFSNSYNNVFIINGYENLEGFTNIFSKMHNIVIGGGLHTDYSSVGFENSTIIGFNIGLISSIPNMYPSKSNYNSKYALSIGYGSSVGSNYNTSIGYRSTSISATNSYSIAIGSESTCLGESYTSVAIGYGAFANSKYMTSIAIGSNAIGTDGSITLGNNFVTSLKCNVQSISYISDKNDKTDITELASSLEFIKKLRVVTYNKNLRAWYAYKDINNTALYSKYGLSAYNKIGHAKGEKKDIRRHVGLIAQDVYDKMIDSFGTTDYGDIVSFKSFEGNQELKAAHIDNESIYRVKYDNLIPFIVKAYQELYKEYDEIALEIETLYNKIMEE